MGYPIKLVDGSTTYTYTWTKGKLTGFSKFSSIGGRHSYTYTYDAWGNCKVTNSTLYDLAYNNPIRYRGYYYDRETGLYYLNARYYNPGIWPS